MIELTPAQAEMVRILQEKLNSANINLELYLKYLQREHNIPVNEKWRIDSENGIMIKDDS